MKIILPNVLKCFTILLLFLPITSYSQKYYEGYYITNTRDTIHGWIGDRGNRMNSSVCHFKPNKKAKVQRLPPNSIKGYSFGSINGSKFRVEEVEVEVQQADNTKIKRLEKKFLRILVKGKLSLYSLRGRDDKTSYFLDKADLGLVQIPPHREMKGDTIMGNRLYLSILKQYTEDCLAVKEKALRAKFTERDFVSIVLGYNKCNGKQNSISFAQPPARMKVAMMIAYNHTFHGNKNPVGEILQGRPTSGGVLFEISRTSIPSISFNIGAFVENYNTSFSPTIIEGTKNFNAIEIPVQLRASWITNLYPRFTPYFVAAGAGTVILNQATNYKYKKINSIALGLGFDLKLTEKYHLNFNIQRVGTKHQFRTPFGSPDFEFEYKQYRVFLSYKVILMD